MLKLKINRVKSIKHTKMNIFVLSKNPKEAALYHCNKHIVKMVLEYTQLLFTLTWCRNSLLFDILIAKDIKVYKLTHINHPCSVWLRESKSNIVWLIDLLEESCKEYTFRYKKTHACEKYIQFFKSDLVPNCCVPDIGMTEFKLCMPDIMKVQGNPVESYRKYYRIHKKKEISMVWFDGEKNTIDPPKWFTTQSK